MNWPIVPELCGFTNPDTYDFYKGNKTVDEVRAEYNILPIDELWIILTYPSAQEQQIIGWAKCFRIKLRFFSCKDVSDFKSMEEISKMRELIYRTVFHAAYKTTQTQGKLYLSLAGGRKTMSADMQEAASLFGCSAILHVVDFGNIPHNMDTVLMDISQVGSCSQSFLPIIISSNLQPSLIVTGDAEPLDIKNYPLDLEKKIQEIDLKLTNDIQNRKIKSSQLYANFYSSFIDKRNLQRENFRKLYFLPPYILKKIQQFRIYENKEKARAIIQRLPKAELHSHLGGVLSPAEIIQVACAVAKTEPDKIDEVVEHILSHKDNITDFEKLIYDSLLDENKYYSIGIDAYQKLGDFQGSSLLQTKTAIQKTIELYAENLIKDNVKYVEIRCSPYKYTKKGLTASQVVNYIVDSMAKFENRLQYKIICIVGRQGENIKDSVEEILKLKDEAPNFSNVFSGIDLAGNEAFGKPSELREIFMPFLQQCLHITIHAGETESVDSIWEAIYHLSAERIGHGLNLFEKPELLQHFINRHIGIEMCPSSNDQIVGFSQNSEKKYPLLDYLNEGLRVTINTDDCGISRTTLSNEFLKAATLCPTLTLWDVLLLIKNSLSIAFVDVKTKAKLMKDFENIIIEIIEKEFVQ